MFLNMAQSSNCSHIIQRISVGKKTTWFVVATILFALALRLCWLFAHPLRKPDRIYLPDSHGYETLAKNIIQHKAFSSDKKAPFRPDIKRTPGYPLFVASIFRFSREDPRFVCVAQALLSAWLVFFSIRLGTLFYSQRAGLIAGGILAIDPLQTVFTGFMISEILFAVFLSWFFLNLVQAFIRPSNKRKLLFTGVLLGSATLCRPISLYLLAPVSLFWILFRHSRGVKEMLIVGVGFFMLILPWMTRNKLVSETFQFTTIGSTNIQFYDVPAFDNHLSGRSITEIRDHYSSIEPVSPIKEYWELIINHPIEYMKVRLLWLYRLLFDPGDGVLVFLGQDYFIGTNAVPRASPLELIWGDLNACFSYIGKYREKRGHVWGFLLGFYVVFYLIFLSVRYIFAIMGLKNLANKKKGLPILILAILGYFLLAPGSVGSARFMLPLGPLVAAMAGVGVASLLSSRSKKR